jgi:hypothetical protein
MQLWQMDIVSGVPLADGRPAKLVTGIDDHSQFVVTSVVVMIPTGRPVCEAFAPTLRSSARDRTGQAGPPGGDVTSG